MNLTVFMEDFVRALALHDWIGPNTRPPACHGLFDDEFFYRVIAAKSAALAIYHFGCSLKELRRQVVLCLETKSNTDTQVLKAASKLFSKYFPHSESIRHAVAHAGELWKHPAEHTYKFAQVVGAAQVAPGSFIGLQVEGNLYRFTWHGSAFSLYMNTSTAQSITEVERLSLAAFS